VDYSTYRPTIRVGNSKEKTLNVCGPSTGTAASSRARPGGPYDRCTELRTNLIVGAGFPGIGTAIQARQSSGLSDYLVIRGQQAKARTGTGKNVIHGIEVDIPSFSTSSSLREPHQSPRSGRAHGMHRVEKTFHPENSLRPNTCVDKVRPAAGKIRFQGTKGARAAGTSDEEQDLLADISPTIPGGGGVTPGFSSSAPAE